MLLIWPTLYWARPSSKVATRNEEEKKSLVPVPCRQDGNGGCYSCRNQHWGSCQVLSDAPKGDLRGLHPSTFNQTQQQHSALALAAFPGAVLWCAVPWHQVLQGLAGPQLLLKMRSSSLQMSDSCWEPPGAIHCSEEKGSGAPPSALASGGSSDCSAWCSGWKLRVVLPVRQPKGNIWKYVSYVFLKETYPESKSHEFNKYS